MKQLLRILAIIFAFGLLLAAYGGRVNPNVWTLPSLATLFLPVVAIFCLAFMAFLLLCRQWQSASILFAALLLSWPTLKLIAPVNVGQRTSDEERQHLKVLTMNVTEFNWMDGNTQPSKNMRYILDQDADIAVIQEGLVYFSYEHLKTIRPMLDELYKKYPYRKKHFFDVGILSKYPFTEVDDPILKQDSLGYFIKVWDVEVPGGNLRVISMHFSSLRFTKNDSRILESMDKPSGRKKRIKSVLGKLDGGFRTHARQAEAVRRIIDKTEGDVLIMGDMNDTPGSFAYRTVCGDDVTDAWAEVGKGPSYTFHANHLYVKIDHILYRGHMRPVYCRFDKKGESDHYPMVALFDR